MAIKKEKNGTYTFYGTLPIALQTTGKKYYKKRGFKTKREAKISEMEYLNNLSINPNKEITINELIEEYNKDAKTKYKESTLMGYRHIERDIIIPSFNNKKIKHITTLEIQRWINDIFLNGIGNQKYAEETCKSMLLHLSGLFTYAVLHDWLIKNPCKGVVRPHDPNKLKKENSSKDNYWEDSTFQEFISKVEDGQRKELFEFAYYSGLRIGEICALQWKMVNFENCTITVDKSLSGSTADITPPKNENSYRTIAIPNRIMDVLQYKYNYLISRPDFNSDWFVFGAQKYISDSTFRRWFNQEVKKAGIKRITFHGLRHSHASYLLAETKLSEQLIAERLGHTVQTLRKTYAHIYSNRRLEFNNEIIKL